MNEPFILPVVYLSQVLELKARFERWGYTYRIAVLINEETIFFEPDEEGSYRAFTGNGADLPKAIAPGLLSAVAAKLVSLGDLS